MFNVPQAFEGNHDAMIIGIFEGEPFLTELDEINNKLNNQLTKRKKSLAKLSEYTIIYTLGNMRADMVHVIGLGKKEELTSTKLRKAIARVGKETTKLEISDVAFVVNSFITDQLGVDDVSYLIGEALALSTYKIRDYKEKTNKVETSLTSIALYSEHGGDSLQQAASVGYIYGMGTNRARTLVNLPGNLLTPTDLADEATTLATEFGLEIEILEQSDMEKLGMGALLAVAAGSDQPPKMITLKYKGNKQSDEVLGFVGKGLTFDSGGISIKSRENMHQMKMDMGGAAAVLGAMEIIGSLKPKVNVLAVIPSSENLLNGSALKPGDVIRAMSGKTIEVRNTDAEGRLILADGMTYAKQLGATMLIDVATLTGAVLVALGDCTTGAVTNDDSLMKDILAASAETGEWIWQFPTYEPYKDMLKTSDVADLNNAPGRLAGSITAGLFIGEFAEETPWVHLDIAGTAWQSKATNLGPLGATGVMARTLARFAMNKEK